MTKEITRRDVVRVGSVIFVSGALGALQAVLTGCGAAKSSSSSSSSCVASTNVTRGPYFVDNQADSNITSDDVDTSIPERSDIRSDTKGSSGTQSGLPLYLNIVVGSYSSGACTPIANAQVHIWHCNAQGVYSDIQASTNDNDADLTGENFLRGYHYTDANGKSTFTTIYPGWYSGRAVHIHVKVRVFDSSGNVTTEATTQLFFDDSISIAVYAANSIYAAESPALLVSLTGSASTSYTGAISIGVATGTIFGG